MSDGNFYYTGCTIKPNEAVGVLKLNESLSVYVYRKMPNRFHRWMARVLLGWVYEDIERSNEE